MHHALTGGRKPPSESAYLRPCKSRCFTINLQLEPLIRSVQSFSQRGGNFKHLQKWIQTRDRTIIAQKRHCFLLMCSQALLEIWTDKIAPEHKNTITPNKIFFLQRKLQICKCNRLLPKYTPFPIKFERCFSGNRMTRVERRLVSHRRGSGFVISLRISGDVKGKH